MEQPVKISSQGFLDPDITVDKFGIEPGMRVADFGCGSGHITILVAQKVGPEGKITALDIMEDKLDSVKSQGKAAGLENIEITRANLEIPGSTKLADHSQDVVILANILFQSQKKLDIIKEGERVLKPGGKIIVIEWKKGGGGFGPPDKLRTEQEDMKNLFEQISFNSAIPFMAGSFHYGLIFKR